MDINEYVPTALIMGILQCDQIGPFLQVFRSKFTYLFGDLGYFEKLHFLNTNLGHSWGTFYSYYLLTLTLVFCKANLIMEKNLIMENVILNKSINAVEEQGSSGCDSVEKVPGSNQVISNFYRTFMCFT